MRWPTTRRSRCCGNCRPICATAWRNWRSRSTRCPRRTRSSSSKTARICWGSSAAQLVGEEADGGNPLPAVIHLYIENLRDEAQDNVARFRQEVRTTLLHELGHYLGLDEDALEQRGLA